MSTSTFTPGSRSGAAATSHPAPVSITKDVQEQLTKQRKRRRAAGEVAYPVEYTRDMADFDSWAHLLLVKICRGLTINDFGNTPPKRVLDLGCGSGLWVLEAAMQWPDSTFVGLDMKDIQPHFDVLADATEEYATVAPRIKWVHQNFLDHISLQSESFDYVRICCIGLGVPEDEWQDLLEEIHRLLKPGGVLEIIEEDLIFPAGRPARNRAPAAATGVIRMSHSDGSSLANNGSVGVLSSPPQLGTNNHSQAPSLNRSPYSSSTTSMQSFTGQTTSIGHPSGGGSGNSPMLPSIPSIPPLESAFTQFGVLQEGVASTHPFPTQRSTGTGLGSSSPPPAPSSSYDYSRARSQSSLLTSASGLSTMSSLSSPAAPLPSPSPSTYPPLPPLPHNYSSSSTSAFPHPSRSAPSLMPAPSSLHPPDVRDHSRLQRAWSALIERRFLAAQPLSILPLYLSSIFVDMQPRPTLQVPLPPNSFKRSNGRYDMTPDQHDKGTAKRRVSEYVANGDSEDGGYELDSEDGMNGLEAIDRINPNENWFVGPEQHTPEDKAKQKGGDLHGLHAAILAALRTSADATAPMHLARTVSIVSHCQAAMWAEYERLYHNEPTTGDNTLREDFEMYWDNWRCDMQDRIGMRRMLAGQAGWPEPLDDPDHGPSWRAWLAAVERQQEAMSPMGRYTPANASQRASDESRISGVSSGGGVASPTGSVAPSLTSAISMSSISSVSSSAPLRGRGGSAATSDGGPSTPRTARMAVNEPHGLESPSSRASEGTRTAPRPRARSPKKVELCRSVRSFIAWKAAAPPSAI